MVATYTKSQYEAQARVLRAQIADEDRRMAELHKIPTDVRGNHERMILMRRGRFQERLDGLRMHVEPGAPRTTQPADGAAVEH